MLSFRLFCCFSSGCEECGIEYFGFGSILLKVSICSFEDSIAFCMVRDRGEWSNYYYYPGDADSIYTFFSYNNSSLFFLPTRDYNYAFLLIYFYGFLVSIAKVTCLDCTIFLFSITFSLLVSSIGKSELMMLLLSYTTRLILICGFVTFDKSRSPLGYSTLWLLTGFVP